MNVLILASSPLHLLNALLLSQNYTNWKISLVFTGQHKDRCNLFSDTINNWKENPFHSVSYEAITSNDEAADLINKTSPAMIVAGNDLISEFTILAYSAKKKSIEIAYMDDGLFSYFEYDKHIPNIIYYHTRNFLRRTIKKYSKPLPHTMGSSPYTKKAFLLYPSKAKRNILKKECLPIVSKENFYNQKSILNKFSYHLIDSLKIKIDSNFSNSLIALPHESRIDKSIKSKIVKSLSEFENSNTTVYIKNHPNNSDSIIKDLTENTNTIEIPKYLPIELFIPLIQPKIFLGGFSSIYCYVKKLFPETEISIIGERLNNEKDLDSFFSESTKKRFAFLLGSLNGAGAEKTIITLSTALVELGNQVDLFLLKNSGDYSPPEGVNIVEVSGSNKKEHRLSISELTRAQHYDLFVTSRAEFYNYIQTENKYCSVHITPTAWIKNPEWQVWKTARKLRKLSEKFQKKNLIALSYGIHDDLVDKLGCKSQDIKVINNPFDIESIQEQGEEPHNIPDYPYIVYVASFIDRKRHYDLLHAFANLKNKSVKLLLLGKGQNEEQILNLAEELGVKDRLVIWGWDINPYRLIKNSKVSILASEAEGLPRVVVESLILKTPVVSTDCPSGPKEVLIDELAEYLVPVGGVEEMTIAIDKALNQYPEISDEMLERFSATSVAKRYMKLLPAQVDQS